MEPSTWPCRPISPPPSLPISLAPTPTCIITLPVLVEPWIQLSDRLEASTGNLPGKVLVELWIRLSDRLEASTGNLQVLVEPWIRLSDRLEASTGNLPVLVEPWIRLSDRLEASTGNLPPGLVGQYPLLHPSQYPSLPPLPVL